MLRGGNRNYYLQSILIVKYLNLMVHCTYKKYIYFSFVYVQNLEKLKLEEFDYYK